MARVLDGGNGTALGDEQPVVVARPETAPPCPPFGGKDTIMRCPIVIEPRSETIAYGVVVPDLLGCFSARRSQSGVVDLRRVNGNAEWFGNYGVKPPRGVRKRRLPDGVVTSGDFLRSRRKLLPAEPHHPPP